MKYTIKKNSNKDTHLIVDNKPQLVIQGFPRNVRQILTVDRTGEDHPKSGEKISYGYTTFPSN